MQRSNNAMMSIVQAEKDKIKEIAVNQKFVEGLQKQKLMQQKNDQAKAEKQKKIEELKKKIELRK